jgi:hypothetical protein
MIGNYSMLYSAIPHETRAKSGVVLIRGNKWTSRITKDSFFNDHIIKVCLKTNRAHITIIGVYAPDEGREEETRRFYKQLQKEIDRYSRSDSLIISGNLIARVGNQPIPNDVRTYGEGCINRKGQTLREFASFNDLKIANIFFRKKSKKIYIECSRI